MQSLDLTPLNESIVAISDALTSATTALPAVARDYYPHPVRVVSVDFGDGPVLHLQGEDDPSMFCIIFPTWEYLVQETNS